MIDGTTLIRGVCGHIWDGAEFDGCPVCAMMRGIETRVADLTADIDFQRERAEKAEGEANILRTG